MQTSSDRNFCHNELCNAYVMHLKLLYLLKLVSDQAPSRSRKKTNLLHYAGEAQISISSSFKVFTWPINIE